jgi:predicted amidophosphoribosyltransferase
MPTSLLRDILDLFFPRTCAICGNVLAGGEEMICVKCLFRMPRTDTWEQPYDNEMAKLFWHLIPIERCCALFHHISHATSARAVYQLKYMHHPEMGIYLGRMLAKKGLGIQFFDGIDAIIPIPLCPRKRIQHGGYPQMHRPDEGRRSGRHRFRRGILKQSIKFNIQTSKLRVKPCLPAC